MALLTIITPTYNRAHTLPRCFESLLRQTCNDFEWIVVDDGSTDETQEVIAGFCTDRFPIIKVWKENGGKHTALNAAHSYVHGDYVLILDSDDYLTETAVEEVLYAWKRYKKDNNVGVLTFLRGTTDREPVCTVQDYEKPVDILRYHRQCRISGDCCEVVRTRLLKEYPFPVFEGERFVAECALWNRIGSHYKCVYINSVIYICEYLEGGLTRSGRAMRIKNPNGGMFTSNIRMDRKNYLSQRLKYGVLYTCYGCFAHIGFTEQLKRTDYPMLAAICYPIGLLMYHRWKREYIE